MYKTVLAILLAAGATAAQATVEIDFNNPSGNLGTNTYTYSNGGLSVTAIGEDSNGAANLYGKNLGGDEVGVGLATDPTNQNEIWTSPTQLGAVFLDVSSLLSSGVTAAQFFMGSTTNGESWIVWDNSGGSFAQVLTGNTELTWADLPDWGSASAYAFTSGGSGQNVLLGGLSLTVGVPEPSTWAMMLLGFGAMGFALRRKRKPAALAQLA